MSRILEMLQAKVPEYHPLVSILEISQGEHADGRLQLDCHKTIAKYVESERRSVEIKTEDGAELVHLRISVDEDDA
jgi:hypothetical protein